MNNPIYEPKGKAKEYGDLCVNIYTGCPHECFYCFAPSVLHRDKEKFHTEVKPREGIVEAVKKQMERQEIHGRLIHLCFTCDPYPTGCDTATTREVIKEIKAAGNHVQILTKGNALRDLDILDSDDWFGITISGAGREQEPRALPEDMRFAALMAAKRKGIRTWVSFEPVINAERVLRFIEEKAPFIDKVKIGKLNYYPSSIKWAEFGNMAEALCMEKGLDYYIKNSLREEMRKKAVEE